MVKRVLQTQIGDEKVWDIGKIVITALLTALIAWIGYITVLALSVKAVAIRVEKKLDTQVTVLHQRITKVDDEAEARYEKLMWYRLRGEEPGDGP